MYGFRVLRAEYILNVSIGQEKDAIGHHLSAVYSLEAKYQNSEGNFLFTVGRKAVKLNAAEKGDGMPVDLMMQKLGNALYPVVLVVSKDARILGVKNFREVFTRWNDAANSVLGEAYSAPAKNYINMAKSNLTGEDSFIKAFGRQIFIQLLFRDQENDSFWFNTKNLAGGCSGDLVKCDRTGVKGNTARFETVGDWNSECLFEYVFSETGDVLSVKGDVCKISDEGPMTQSISLCVLNGGRVAKKANKLISFLMD